MIRPKQFRIGDWLADADNNRLCQDDQTVQLEPKVMDLLVELASAEGRPLSQAELRRRLWKDVHVAEGAVKHLVWDLRRSLNDDARNPTYVETIPRQGYRLLAPVQEADRRIPTAERPSRLSRAQWAYLGGGLLILLAAGLAIGFGDASSPLTNDTSDLRLKPLTSFPGNEIDPSLSPDGRRLAFAWEGASSQFDIYVLEIASGVLNRLTDHPAPEGSPTWSPDGNTIVFLRAGSHGGVFAVASSGGREDILAGPEIGQVRDVVFSPQGDRLVLAARPEGDFRYRLGLLTLDERTISWLPAPPANSLGDSDPSFSPDGERVAFRRSFFEGNDDLFLLDPENGGVRRLSTDHASIIGLSFTTDGRSVIFSSNRIPPRSLWLIDIDTRQLRWLPSTTGFPADPWAAPDRLVFQTMRCDANIWALSRLGENSTARLMAGSSTRVDQFPQISPDGRRVAFISDRSGSPEIWVTRLDDDRPRKVTQLGGPKISVLRWSPEGERIVFDVQTGGTSSLRVLDLGSGETATLPAQGGNEAAPSWSGDGRSVYFASDRTGDWQIFRRPLQGQSVQITRGGGFAALEDSSGEFLYYTRRDRDGLWRVPLMGRAAQAEEIRIIDQPSGADLLNWTLTSDGIFVTRSSREGRSISRYDYATLTPHTAFELDRWSPYPGLSASPDGSLLLFTRLDSSASDLVLLESTDGRVDRFGQTLLECCWPNRLD